MLEQPTLTHSPEGLRERVAERMVLIEHLRECIRELEARLAEDSHNSSRPPSSDSPFKKPPPRCNASQAGASQVDNRADTVSLAP